MINCGHCGGRHATVAEVRSCSGAPARSADSPPMFDESRAATPRRAAPVTDAAAVALAPDWDRLAGPSALARNLVITSGQAVPAPWELAPRVVVEADHPDTAKYLNAPLRNWRGTQTGWLRAAPPLC